MVLKRTDCFGCYKTDCLLVGLVRLLGQGDSLDVGEDSRTPLGDSSQELVQLFFIPDGKLLVTGETIQRCIEIGA